MPGPSGKDEHGFGSAEEVERVGMRLRVGGVMLNTLSTGTLCDSYRGDETGPQEAELGVRPSASAWWGLGRVVPALVGCCTQDHAKRFLP